MDGQTQRSGKRERPAQRVSLQAGRMESDKHFCEDENSCKGEGGCKSFRFSSESALG